MPASTAKLNIHQWHVSLLKADNTTPSSAQQIATNVTLPPLVRNFDSDPRSAMPGQIGYPLGFNTQELTVTMKGITQEFWEELYKAVKRVLTVKIEANGCDYDTQAGFNIDLTVKGNLSQLPGINFAALQNATLEWKLMINEFTYLFDLSTSADKTEIIYKPASFLYSVNGTNLISADATAIGVTPGT